VKITVWGINYDPEPTGIGPFNTDLCAYLVERGHDVRMVTTFPYYPWWKKPAEARGKFFERKTLKGVDVHRCWHYVPAKPSTLKRLVHELSFLATSTLRLLFLPATDIYIVISPPLFLGIGAFVVSRILRRPFQFHVQDLQPDAALGLGMIKPGPAVKALYALENWTYRRAALVSGISQGMLDAFAKKRVPSEKVYFFPNWIPDGARAAASAASFRRANSISPDTALIAYSGNVGMKQGLEVVVEAAALARTAQSAPRPVQWAICGEGAAKEALQRSIENKGVDNVKLYPLQPDDLYQALLTEADISLITQQRGTGQFFFPSKLLSILQYGRPVLAVADDSSELARAVQEGKFGLVVAPGDASALVQAAAAMLQASEEQRAAWASNGRRWVDQFRRSQVLRAYEQRIEALVAARS
jgi:colanic acid biosynthesis glycosyl transferase WcaI